MADIPLLLILRIYVCSYVTVTAIQIYQPPAEIVSENGRRPLDFLVGSQIILRCRLTLTGRGLNVSSLYMTFHKDTVENFPLNVAVVEDGIRFVVHNATPHHSGDYYCESSTHGTLTTEEVRVGYVPSDDFRVTCRLRRAEVLHCCVEIDANSDQHSLEMNPVQVSWHMRMTSHPTRPEKIPDQFLCVNWTVQNVACGSGFTVAATASNTLGSASSSLTLCPLKEVEPGPVVNLMGRPDPEVPHKLTITWYHPDDLSLSRRLEMGGVNYTVAINYQDHGQVQPVFMESDIVEYVVEGLLPFTFYNVTVTPHSLCCAGPSSTIETQTAESAPLTAPEVIAWAHGQNDAVIYLKEYAPGYQGGEIIKYFLEVCTKKKSCQNVTKKVTSPLVLKGCEQGCSARIKAATRQGPSKESSALEIPPHLASTPKLVEVERKADGLRTIFWKKSINSVVSVHWCYGSQFAEDPPLIDCQITVRSAVADHSCCSQIVKVSEPDRKAYPETIDKRWYFGVGAALYDQPENSNDRNNKAIVPVRILWESCLFDENRAPSQPALSLRAWENGTGLTVKAGSWCTTTLPPPGKPHNATVSVAEKHPSCSTGPVSRIWELVDEWEMHIGGLIPGCSYTICVTYYNRLGNESATKEQVLMTRHIADGDPRISVTILVVILSVLGLLILAVVFGVSYIKYKKKSSRFETIQWPKGKKVQLQECCDSKPKLLTSDKGQTLTEFQVTRGDKDEMSRQETSNVMIGHTNSLIWTSDSKYPIVKSTVQQSNLVNSTAKAALKKTRRDSQKTYINHSDLSTFGCMTPEMVPLISSGQCTVSRVSDDQQVRNMEGIQRNACPQETAVLSDIQMEGLEFNQSNHNMTDICSHASQHDSAAVALCSTNFGGPQLDRHTTADSLHLGSNICRLPHPDLFAQHEYGGGKCSDVEKLSEPHGSKVCVENLKLTSCQTSATADLADDCSNKLQVSLFEPAQPLQSVPKDGCLLTTSSKGYVKLAPRDHTTGDLDMSWRTFNTCTPSTGSPKALATDERLKCSFPGMVSIHFLHKTTEKIRLQATYVKPPALTMSVSVTNFKESGYVPANSGITND